MRRCLGIFAVAGLTIVGQTQGSVAFHDDATPLLHSGAIYGPGWVVYTFTTDGSKVVADIWIKGYDDASVPAQVGEVLYAQDNVRLFGQGVTSTSTDGVYVHSDAVPGAPVHADLLRPASGQNLGTGLWMNNGGTTLKGSGTYNLLLWASGGIRKATFSLRGGAGTEFVSLTTGTDAFLYMSKDFHGTANAAAGVGNTQANSSARANFQTGVVEQIEHTFVGFFYTPASTGVDRLTMTGPDGPRNCSCWWWNYTVDQNGEPAGPGTYTFELTGAGAGGVLGEVILGGVDVVLPPGLRQARQHARTYP